MEKMWLSALQNRFPEVAVDQAEIIGTGQNNLVVLVPPDWVFRFPRYREGCAALRREAALLDYIGPRVSLPVPRFIYRSHETDRVGEVLAGYRRIGGQPLSRGVMEKLAEGVVCRMAWQLAEFLRDLHGLPIEAMDGVLPPYDGYCHWFGLYQRIQARLFPVMRPEARHWAAQHFEGFLADYSGLGIKPKLIHGDFGATNILSDGRQIAGIIDFGAAGLGDPAYDYASLLACYGEDFVNRLATYGTDIEQYRVRMAFYMQTFALQEALFGLEYHDAAAFASGIEAFR